MPKICDESSHRKIYSRLNIAVGTVSVFIKRASELGLSWPLSSEMSDSELEELFFPPPPPPPKSSGRFGHIVSDCPAIHQELKKKGVTKQLLWEEYIFY